MSEPSYALSEPPDEPPPWAAPPPSTKKRKTWLIVVVVATIGLLLLIVGEARLTNLPKTGAYWGTRGGSGRQPRPRGRGALAATLGCSDSQGLQTSLRPRRTESDRDHFEDLHVRTARLIERISA
jgi:hypothetical protein